MADLLRHPGVTTDKTASAGGIPREVAGWIGLLLVLALIWGGSVPFTKLGLRDFPPLTLTALRYLVAAPCFAVFLRNRHLTPPLLLATAALGVLGIGAGQALQTLGVRETSASVATVISATIPIFVVVFAFIRLHQPIRLRQALGLGVAFIGVGLVAIGDPRRLGAIGTAALRGDVLMVLSALAISLYYVLSIGVIERYSVVTVTALSSVAGGLALAPLAAWELRHAAVRLTATGTGVVLYLGLLVTVVGMLIWFYALRRLPARVPAALQYLQPLVGVAASAMLFGDPVDWWFGAGTGLVLLGIAWTTY